MQSTKLFLVGLLASTATLVGCETTDIYVRDDVGVSYSQSTRNGVIEAKRDVTIEGKQSLAGVLIGGVGGAAVGSQIGDGSGQDIATAAGAIVGAIVGAELEKRIRRQGGAELTIRLENGERLLIVLPAEDARGLLLNDPVRVITDRGKTFVYRREAQLAALSPTTEPSMRATSKRFEWFPRGGGILAWRF